MADSARRQRPQPKARRPATRPSCGAWPTPCALLEYLASGMTEAEPDFPDLTHEDIRACLAFAADRERRMVSIPPAA